MNRDNAPLHVIFGAGQVGSRLAAGLAARGLRVRVVRRGSAPVASASVESVSGDASDQAFAARAAAGAAVIYDCLNPPYHRWPELLLPMARGTLHAAASTGARLVALDCLYMYGRPAGPLREDSPLAPCSKKGALRVALAELRLEAHRRGDARVTIGRASDFFGANLPFSFWGDRFYARVLAGKPAECFGDPDLPHAYTYVDDVARALATLGEREEALGRVWHLPTDRAESTRALVARLGRALGVRAEVARVPRLVLRALGLFSPFMREAAEMTYQWEVPFELDDTRFRAAFGYGPTPIDEAVAQTAAWARARYQLAAAALTPPAPRPGRGPAAARYTFGGTVGAARYPFGGKVSPARYPFEGKVSPARYSFEGNVSPTRPVIARSGQPFAQVEKACASDGGGDEKACASGGGDEAGPSNAGSGGPAAR